MRVVETHRQRRGAVHSGIPIQVKIKAAAFHQS